MTGNADLLAGLLKDRKDWRLETEPDPPHWCFGVDGASRLVLTPVWDGFLLYRADQDRERVIPRIEQVESWLAANEHEHAGLTPLQEELKACLEREQPGAAGA